MSLVQNSLKIGFRVDTDTTIGTGHLIEVISLINALRKKILFTPVIITTEDTFTLKKLKEAFIDNIAFVSKNLPEEDEAKVIITLMKKENCENLVIDLQYRSNKFYGYLSNNLKSTTVILDNSEHKEIPATVVVNFAITQSPEFYENLGNNYFIGPKYAVLDDSITRKKPIYIKDEVKSIFVNQGGADPYGFTAKIIRSLTILRLKQEINIIVGGALASKHLNELEHLKLNLADNYHFYNNILLGDVFDIMEESDLAITAAGNTLYELAYFGVPPIVICHHERHNQVARRFAEQRAAINVGIGSNLGASPIVGVIKRLLESKDERLLLSKNIKKITDGLGSKRVTDKILAIC